MPSPAATAAPNEVAFTNIPVEQALLGSLMMKPELSESIPTTFQTEHFSDILHREIFEEILSLGKGATAFSVVHAIARGDRDKTQYVTNLLKAIVGMNPGVIAQEARTITDLWRRRTAAGIASQIQETVQASSSPTAVSEVLKQAASSLDGILNEQGDALGLWDSGDDDYVIPPREWLLGATFCRRFLSSLLADGGVGKTAVRVAQMVSLATGRKLTDEHVFQRCRVLIVSLEDDRDELRRRVNAVMRHYGIGRSDIKGWLFLAAPKGLRLAEMRDGAPQAAQLESILRQAIKDHRLDVISLDPFVKSHGLNENDNAAIDFVCTILTKIAIDCNCAVDAPHHTKKGLDVAGEADNGRGAGSMKNAARLVYTLTRMTKDEATTFGVPEAERRGMVRVDSGKVNIAPASREAKWFKIIGVPLDNGTPTYPNGDEVQTVEPWQPPGAWDSMDGTLLNKVLDEIDAGLPNGSRFSDSSRAGERSAALVVVKHVPEKTEGQAKEVIRAWMKSGTLFAEPYHDPSLRKERLGLRVNATKRPL